MSNKSKIKIWKTFDFGKDKEAGEEDFLVYDDVYFAIKEIKNSSSEKGKINLVQMTLEELGFDNGAKRPYFYEAAFRLGLKCFPAKDIIDFRREYSDQAFGERIFVATDPVLGPDNVNSIFVMGHCYLQPDSPPERWVRLFPSDPIGVIGPTTAWIFAI